MKRQIAIALLFVTVLFTYLGVRLSVGLGGPMWGLLVALLSGVLIFPITRYWSRTQSLGKTIARWFIYMDMGLLSFLLAFTILRDVLFWPLIWLKPQLLASVYGPQGTSVIFLVAILLLAYGAWSAARGPLVKEVSVAIKHLPLEFEGFKIAQISDLHLGPMIGRSYVDRVVRVINGLLPDVVTLTGDIGDGTVDSLRSAIEGFKVMTPDKPKLFVTGNHEYYWDAKQWIQAFTEVGIQPLLNSKTEITVAGMRMIIAGVIDPAARIVDPKAKPEVVAALGDGGSAAVKILLAHNPNIVYEAEKAGFDLQLSGHTHAGQFFPWTLVVPRVHEYFKGLRRCGKMWIYVSSGTGSWGPQVRVGSQTEITLIKLVADTNPNP